MACIVLACVLTSVSAFGLVDCAFANEPDSTIAEFGKVVAQKTEETRSEGALQGEVASQDEGALQAEDASLDESAPQAEAALPDVNYVTRIAEIGEAVAQKTNEVQGPAILPHAAFTGSVGTILQNDIMAGGCEVVSLGIVLESMGVETDLDAIVNDHLNMDGNYLTGYAGDPYYAGGGFAPGIVDAANGYLESTGSSVRAVDLTGSSFDVLSDYVSHGYPVLVWTTMGFEDPDFTGESEDEAGWYNNEHCVVLYGFSEDGGIALVSDPLEGYVERETARFADIYEQCGSWAVVLR